MVKASTFGSSSSRFPVPVQPVTPRHGIQSVGREDRELPLLRFFTRNERGMMYSPQNRTLSGKVESIKIDRKKIIIIQMILSG